MVLLIKLSFHFLFLKNAGVAACTIPKNVAASFKKVLNHPSRVQFWFMISLPKRRPISCHPTKVSLIFPESRGCAVLSLGRSGCGCRNDEALVEGLGGWFCKGLLLHLLGQKCSFQKAKFGVVQLSASIFWFCHADMVRSSVFFFALSSFGCRVAMLG